MKKLALLAAFLLILSNAAPAFARLVDIGLCVADLPANWKIFRDDNISTLVSPERNCVFIITDGLSVDAHKKKVAPVVAEYAQVIQDRPEQNITVTRVHGLRVVVTILGDHPDRVPLYYSIKLKDESQAVPYR